MAQGKPRLAHLAKNCRLPRKLGDHRIFAKSHLPHPLAKRRIARQRAHPSPRPSRKLAKRQIRIGNRRNRSSHNKPQAHALPRTLGYQPVRLNPKLPSSPKATLRNSPLGISRTGRSPFPTRLLMVQPSRHPRNVRTRHPPTPPPATRARAASPRPRSPRKPFPDPITRLLNPPIGDRPNKDRYPDGQSHIKRPHPRSCKISK